MASYYQVETFLAGSRRKSAKDNILIGLFFGNMSYKLSFPKKLKNKKSIETNKMFSMIRKVLNLFMNHFLCFKGKNRIQSIQPEFYL